MGPADIHDAIDKLRRAEAHGSGTRGWLTRYDRALIALADKVDLALGALDGEAKREMTNRQLRLLRELRACVPIQFGRPIE